MLDTEERRSLVAAVIPDESSMMMAESCSYKMSGNLIISTCDGIFSSTSSQ